MILKVGYNKMADWWTLGILIYEMVIGQPPFNSFNQKEMLKSVLLDAPKIKKNAMSKPLKSLIEDLLMKDPSKRLGSDSKGGVDSIK